MPLRRFVKPAFALCAALLAFGLTGGASDSSQTLGWIGSAQAGSAIEMPLELLVLRAARIVVATPQDSYSVWEQAEGGARRIVTYHRVRIDQEVAGQGPADVKVRSLGGVVGEIGQRVEGEAVLEKGVPALLFLVPRSDGSHSVLGMSQGIYPLVRQSDGTVRLTRPKGLGLLVPPRSGALSPSSRELVGRPVQEAVQLIVNIRKSRAQ